MCLLFCRKDRRSVLNNSICFFVEIFNVTIRSLSFKEIKKISSCGRLSRAQSALLPASGSSTASNSPAPPPLITSDLQLPLRSTLHKPSGLSDIGIRLRDSIAESCDRSRTAAGTARCKIRYGQQKLRCLARCESRCETRSKQAHCKARAFAEKRAKFRRMKCSNRRRRISLRCERVHMLLCPSKHAKIEPRTDL